jgi:predicted RNase H-like nuclease (RuvC/YqgF family)
MRPSPRAYARCITCVCAGGDPEAAFRPGRQPKARPTDPATAALRRENAALREENVELKRRLEEGKRQADAYSSLYADRNRLSQENSALKKQLADARAANPGVSPAEERAAGRLAREIDRLKEALAKAEMKLAADPGEVGKLERQLKAARTRVHNLTIEKNVAWRAVTRQ